MPNTAAERAVHVVVGVVAHGAQILVAQRPRHSHQGGRWEFPGGKVRADEAAHEALARELLEELGIHVRAAYPLIQVRHAYPDKRVFLDVWRVTDYDGVPQGREGQVIDWIDQHQLSELEFPEANRAIVQATRLPALYVISDSRRFGKPEFLRRLKRALKAGTQLVQLREPHLSDEDYQSLAHKVADLCHRYGAKLMLNGAPEWVSACGADGVHLNSRRLRQLRARPLTTKYWVAASVHDEEELEKASQLGVDFVVLAPVLPTGSHPHAKPLGWQRFRELCATTNLPVYALGGQRAEHLQPARDAGAQGLAMISGIWEAEEMEAVITTIRDA